MTTAEQVSIDDEIRHIWKRRSTQPCYHCRMEAVMGKRQVSEICAGTEWAKGGWKETARVLCMAHKIKEGAEGSDAGAVRGNPATMALIHGGDDAGE